jgi:SMI1 / KNR4 family (SUKH-1)
VADLIASVKSRALDPKTRTDQTDVYLPHVGEVLSEGVISATERELGLQLPQTLRKLYTEIGDGGFGPGYGFLRMSSPSRPHDDTVVDLYQSFHGPDPSDSTWKWPEGLLLISDWGCAIRTGVICGTNRIVVFDPNLHDSDWADTFLDQDCSLEEWLQSWCDGVDLWKEIYGSEA